MITKERYRPEMHWSTLLRRGERGQGLAEMAIIMPLVLLIIAGVIDFGHILRTYTIVVNAAREAAFAGAAAQLSDNDIRALVNDELERGGVQGGTATTTITYQSNGSPAEQTIIVNLTYEVPLLMLSLAAPSITVRTNAETVTFW